MRRILCLIYISIVLFSILAGPALAQEPDYDRINEVASNLNCPTCAGINLADCRTLTCQQWRDKIGDLIQEGYSDQQILDYFATRYGEQVLQEPPKRGFTLALWILPVIALLAGGIWLVHTIRGWADQQAAPATATTAPASQTNLSSNVLNSDDYLSQVEKDLGIDEA